MPPHCDTMDVPVVTAARQALEREDVNLILPYVKDSASADVKSAFEKTLRARKVGPAAREVADLYFYETAVRLVEAMLGLEVYSHHFFQAMKAGAHAGGHEHHHG